MRQRVFPLVRSWSIIWLLTAGWVLAPTAVFGQTFRAPSLPAASAPAGTSSEARSTALVGVLEEGRSLEKAGRWSEALGHYEEALRDWPNDAALLNRFDTARLHYSFEQRYSDRSFRASVQTLRPRQAAEQYTDLLNKVNAHYYRSPPWRELVRRGARAMDIALADEKFLRTHGIRTAGQQVERLRAELVELPERHSIRTSRDAAAVASQAARLASTRIGLNETATLMEFTAAAAGGLDHYSAYLTADQLRDIYSQIDGNFVGLGVELKADEGALLIVRVIPGSPAEKAGIQARDRITAVDGQTTQELSTDEAAGLLTGEEGSVVHVTVVSPDQSPRRIAIRRAHVEVPSLEDVKIIDPADGVAYVRVPTFQKTTARDLEAALWDLHGQGMRSLILDLRGNPGGLLSASVEVADKFVASGPIVSTRGRSEMENFNYTAHRPGTWRVPLVVLIDGDSASASEIFAAAIQDSGRGKVVGTRSYGKGSVQGIFPLGGSGAGARLTTSSFYSPNGHPINKLGISPNIDTGVGSLAGGESAGSTDAAHRSGYRGVERAAGDRSATNPSGTATTASYGAVSDPTLEIAIEAARNEPVAEL